MSSTLNDPDSSMTIQERFVSSIGKIIDGTEFAEKPHHYLVASPEQDISKFKVTGFCKVTAETIQKTQMKVILQNLESTDKNKSSSSAIKPLEDSSIQREIWQIGFKMMSENVNIFIMHSDTEYNEETILERIKQLDQKTLMQSLLKSSVA